MYSQKKMQIIVNTITLIFSLKEDITIDYK